MICLCPQSTAVTNLQGGVVELDSDMADITQSLPAENVLSGEDEDLQLWDVDTAGGRLGGFVTQEPDSISASSHIASSLGINPHTLQVENLEQRVAAPATVLAEVVLHLLLLSFADHEGFTVCRG